MKRTTTFFPWAMGAMVFGLTGYFVSTARAAGIPTADTLTYSGLIYDAAGRPVDNPALLIGLSLWDVPTGGMMPVRGCEVRPTMTAVTRGRFRLVMPAACTAAVQANPDLYVEVFLPSGALPRQKIGAVPYAVEALRASSATGDLAQAVVPPGAVMAFDLDSCPSGWTALAPAQGRVIVGTQPGLARGVTVGADSVTLSVAQLAQHTHGVGTMSIGGGDHAHTIPCRNTPGIADHPHTHDDSWSDTVAPAERGQNQFCNRAPITAPSSHSHTLAGQTAAAGQGTAVDNRQASLALLYCRKS